LTWIDQKFKYKWHDFKYFLIAFAFHMILPSLTEIEEDKKASEKRAKALYKKAIRRSECPIGAFNLLVSLYIRQSRLILNRQEQA
jgi:hypothetical protein